jgi:hypothetical protein
MAIFNEILVGRFNRALQKLTGIKGAAPTKQLSSEVTAQFQFPLGNEFRYLETWNRFAVTYQLNAGAGGNGTMRFRNPPSSGAVAVIEKINVFNAAGSGSNQINIDGPVGGNILDLTNDLTLATTRFDARGAQNTSMKVSTNIASAIAALGNTIWFFILPNLANVFLFEVITKDLEEITVLPGDTLQVRMIPLNVQLNGCIWWRERALEESER